MLDTIASKLFNNFTLFLHYGGDAMQTLEAFISLFFSPLISLKIWRSRQNKKTLGFNDLVNYGIFCLLNMIVVKFVCKVVPALNGSSPWDGTYAVIAFIIGALLPYIVEILRIAFPGKVEITQK
ncbi:hypothetical protein MOZ60_10835 [Stecheria sp. CLA-KB-P133]|uniref:Uncharacterized protein n=1 Tax=Grylomicrobium aquisgranensis TaxID=2926318 RepID=A0AB35U6H6_9FIRM|nr:hypothetical protein [Stecheria sp. CLA-KB-P133]